MPGLLLYLNIFYYYYPVDYKFSVISHFHYYLESTEVSLLKIVSGQPEKNGKCFQSKFCSYLLLISYRQSSTKLNSVF